jgi:glycerophosphoryl diester phosphodiesterase
MKNLCLLGFFGAIIGCSSMTIKTEVLNKVAVHGHRGSRGTHPENTLPAFQEAVAAGVRVLEMDLQLTADDVPVVSHDPYLNNEVCRYKNGSELKTPIPIRSLKAAELAAFDCGSVPHPRFPEQMRIPSLSIPSFEEILRWWKENASRLELNVETKMSANETQWKLEPTHFSKQIVALLRKYGAVEKTILQSFDFRTLAAAKQIEPRLRISCLFEGVPDFCSKTKAQGAEFASPNLAEVTLSEVVGCHQLGIQVVPWTANSEEEWRTLLAHEVDAIITDYPRKLGIFLTELRKAGNRR